MLYDVISGAAPVRSVNWLRWRARNRDGLVPPAVRKPGSGAGRGRRTECGAGRRTRRGYIIYFRHTATDFSQNDEKMRDFDDCANQRNLTDAGREQAKKIAAAWRGLNIPVGRVLASPYCRTREVAQLAFGASSALDAGVPAPRAIRCATSRCRSCWRRRRSPGPTM
ncbi:MAG: histidine phosphatase family protein [Betaproteobacteria bacterium]|nr:histidine phosphatase family protein [Betaproteobacteria bacterium]